MVRPGGGDGMNRGATDNGLLPVTGSVFGMILSRRVRQTVQHRVWLQLGPLLSPAPKVPSLAPSAWQNTVMWVLRPTRQSNPTSALDPKRTEQPNAAPKEPPRTFTSVDTPIRGASSVPQPPKGIAGAPGKELPHAPRDRWGGGDVARCKFCRRPHSPRH